MFQLASSLDIRKFISAGVIGAATICLALGSWAWSLAQCDMRDYLDRAATSPANPREMYLFACGHVWRSMDRGRAWAQVPARGLPIGLRDAHIAADRRPGLLYLGVVANRRLAPNLKCLSCAWVRVEPALYISHDGGVQWRLAYRFKPSAMGNTWFLAVNADPDYVSAAWVILKRGDEVAYYATNTAGRLWQKTCVEENPAIPRCDPPDELLSARHERSPSMDTDQP